MRTEYARELIEAGYSLTALPEGRKKPPPKGWTEEDVTNPDRFTSHNIGVKTGELVVLDFDGKREARAFYRKYRSLLKTLVETRKGIHAYFRTDEDIANRQCNGMDVRGRHGYVVGAGSEVEGWMYGYVEGHGLVDIDDLPAFDSNMVPSQFFRNAPERRIKNVRSYIDSIISQSGSRAHDQTFRVACCLRDAGMTESEAMAEMLRWQETNCIDADGNQELWTVEELAHKISDAYRIARSSKQG